MTLPAANKAAASKSFQTTNASTSEDSEEVGSPLLFESEAPPPAPVRTFQFTFPDKQPNNLERATALVLETTSDVDGNASSIAMEDSESDSSSLPNILTPKKMFPHPPPPAAVAGSSTSTSPIPPTLGAGGRKSANAKRRFTAKGKSADEDELMKVQRDIATSVKQLSETCEYQKNIAEELGKLRLEVTENNINQARLMQLIQPMYTFFRKRNEAVENGEDMEEDN